MTSTLVILPRFPDDRSGTGQRSRLLVESAVEMGPTHVVLLDGAKTGKQRASLPGVASITTLSSERITPRGPGVRRLGGALRVLAPGHAYAADPALRKALLELISRHGIDVAVFRYARLFAAAGLTSADGPRMLVDVDDRDDQKYQTRLERLFGKRFMHTAPGQWQLARLARVLRTHLSRAHHVWFVTPEDVWTLSPASTSILPNVPYWQAPGTVQSAAETEPVALFVGIHDHLPNREGMDWFLSRVWPILSETVPRARLRIVGRGAWPAMAAAFPEVEGVSFVGEVEDLAAEYRSARLAICPVREGGGSKIKLIEAAAFARPIVATSHAARGFDGAGLDGISRTDTPEAFAAACAEFLTDRDAAGRHGSALRAWQAATYSRAAFLAEVQSRFPEP